MADEERVKLLAAVGGALRKGFPDRQTVALRAGFDLLAKSNYLGP